jgi:hypothetical protein
MKKSVEEMLAKFMADRRKIDPRDRLASAVLTDKQWEVFYELQKTLRSNYGLFAGASLSAFCNPMDKELEDFRNEAFEVSVLFAITSKEVEGSPKLFVVDDERATLVLSRMRAPYLRWDELSDPLFFADKIWKRLTQIEHDWLPAQRKIVNKPEFYAGRQLIMNRVVEFQCQYESLQGHKDFDPKILKELIRNSPRMLREVALKRLAPKLHLTLDCDLERMFNISNVDILVHSVHPNTPILGIEIDGAHHIEPGQQAKDLKKERIFDALKLPLMRVLPADVTKCLPSEWLLKKESYWYAELFARVAQLLAHRSTVEHEDYLEFVKLDHALEQAKDDLAKALYDKPMYLLLTDEQQSNLQFQLNCTTEEEAMWFHLQERTQNKAMSKDPNLDLTWGGDLLKYCSAPKVTKDTEGVWSFKATFKHKGVIEAVTAPRIKCVTSVLDEQDVAEIFDEVFFFYAKSWVENRVEELKARR